MNKDPKSFVKQTILTREGKRIVEVMERYWKYVKDQRLKEKIKPTDTFEIAKKVFGI